MKIVGGYTIEVYRPTEQDRFGDSVDSLVGTIGNVVMQWTTPDPIDRFQENASMSAMVFAPRSADIKLMERDRFKLDGKTYQVIGSRLWDEDSAATGRNYGYYMMQVETVS